MSYLIFIFTEDQYWRVSQRRWQIYQSGALWAFVLSQIPAFTITKIGGLEIDLHESIFHNNSGPISGNAKAIRNLCLMFCSFIHLNVLLVFTNCLHKWMNCRCTEFCIHEKFISTAKCWMAFPKINPFLHVFQFRNFVAGIFVSQKEFKQNIFRQFEFRNWQSNNLFLSSSKWMSKLCEQNVLARSVRSGCEIFLLFLFIDFSVSVCSILIDCIHSSIPECVNRCCWQLFLPINSAPKLKTALNFQQCNSTLQPFY